ncbi:MAG TPA: hypothetical protein VGQ39_21710 [Pyrinomonadaceae bacterium]|nr:hypothetical protein [Pyrinomonadaceae bacterium]
MTRSILYDHRATNTAKTRVSRRGWLMGLLALTLSCFFAIPSVAQQAPPPLGPPTYRSEKVQLGVGLLSGFVKAKVAEIVTDENKKLSQQRKRARVEALPLKVFSPMRVATLHTNRPNQFYVKLPMIISVRVKIPLTSDRTISIPFALNLSCEGWQTGSGTVQIVGQTGPPSIEGGNIIEEVLMVKDLIDNRIRSDLTLPGAIRFSLPNSSCVTIGASRSQSVGDPFAFIAYDPPSRFGPIVDRATQTVTVTFKKLKRLRARNKGAILYQASENILLETYANFVLNQSAPLTMREDDEVSLTLPPAVVKAPGDLLVIIANIQQQPTSTPEDSAFVASTRSANFSPGIHTLQIRKTYSEPPGPGHTHPVLKRVPAYELTYEVRYTPMIRLQGRATQP